MPIQFSEIYPDIGGAFSFTVTKILTEVRSPFQKIQVVESSHLGRVLLIDDLIMLTERDEFIYHEMIAHVPLFTHPRAEKILIIGGGDGGTVRECLKHPQVKQIDLVDIDEMVTRVCLKYLPSVAGKIFSEKVRCRFEDGVKLVQETSDRYDLIIIDSTDPISVGEGLFTREFYRNCFNILNDNGILVAQSETPAYMPETVAGISTKLKSVFPKVRFYQAHIPTYPSGHWLFAFASKKHDALKHFREKDYQQFAAPLRYYNAEIHRAAFLLPNFVRELVGEA